MSCQTGSSARTHYVGGPQFKVTEGVSYMIETQEVDYYWEKLTAGGRKVIQMTKLGSHSYRKHL